MNFDHYVDQMLEDIIKSTQEMVRIPSVKKEPLPGKPFGEDVNRALEYILELGKSMGFRTKNVDGYIGYIEFGEGEELIGILAHLDVVPAGSDWTYPPFEAEIHDGKIYGRGSIDDKGPAIAALYAMKAIKDTGIKLNKRVRLILGLDEESGWECIRRYKETEEAPDVAFTPDADYPVIHAEKGIVNYKFFQQYNSENALIKIITIKGGNRPNMVPDSCDAVIEVQPERFNNVCDNLKQLIENKGFKIEINADNDRIALKAHGKSAHGSVPHKGINAISQLMVVLYECMGNYNTENPFIQFYHECIGLETDGASIGCAMEDDVSGRLTFNIGLISADSNYAEAVANIRYPVTFKEEDIYAKIQDMIQKYGVKVEKLEHQSPLYVPKGHSLVQKLMKVYRDVTGDDREPVAIGGGTYARAFENAVAFGAAFPGEPELAHEKDEYIAIDSLIKNTKIFTRAIYELAKE